MHDLSVIVLLSGALAVALVFGWITERLGLSTLVGYMLAGIAVGPYTPGFVADSQLASQMAEIGVILLMFGVGLHFHPQDLLRVRRIAIPGAFVQSAVAVIAGWGAARLFGWSHSAGIVFGMALAVASTVVLMRMLIERDRLSTRAGHVAVGWLIVEDLFTVVALVILPAMAARESTTPVQMAIEVVIAVGKAAAFAALIWLLGTKIVSIGMEKIARARSAELFTLSIFVLALGVAILAAEGFHVSGALGAFFAGLVVGQSRFGHQASVDTAPFRDVFSALFFVSVGMLFDPGVLISDPWKLLAALFIVLILKPLTALGIVLLLRDTMRTGVTVAVGLAQIGEFSFILAALGRSLNILPTTAFDVLVGAAIGSIALNPLLFKFLPYFERQPIEPLDEKAEEAHREAAALPVLVLGAGELTRRFIGRCQAAHIPVSLLSTDKEALDSLRTQAVTIYGDPGDREVLKTAGAIRARAVVVADGSLSEKMRLCIAARAVNPRASIVAVASSGAERVWLEEFGAAFVCDALDEIGESLLRATRGAI